MKLRTVLELQDALDKDFGWRVREIDEIKKSVQTSTGLRQVTLVRAGLPLLYAHWEGCIKSSAEALLNFVSNQRRKYNELRPCYATHGLASTLDLLAGSKNHTRRVEAIEFVANRLGERASFSWKDRVHTRSNLNWEVFENIAAAVGIDSTRYRTRGPFIDQSLLKRRNSIAHGERLDLSPQDLNGIADDVLMLLRWFKTDVENCASLGAYLR